MSIKDLIEQLQEQAALFGNSIEVKFSSDDLSRDPVGMVYFVASDDDYECWIELSS